MGIFKTIGTVVGAVAAAPLTGGASVVAAVVGGAVAGRVAGAVADHTPVGSLTNSFVDNVFRDKAIPIEGSIVHCSLFGAEHTGVYIGDGQIVELLGTGAIRTATADGFINGTNAISIYVACNDVIPIGSKAVAKRAKDAVGESRNYQLLFDNCHQFTFGCITGDFSDGTTAFWLLEKAISEHLNGGRSITWRVWDLPVSTGSGDSPTGATQTSSGLSLEPRNPDEEWPFVKPLQQEKPKARQKKKTRPSGKKPASNAADDWPFPSGVRPK